MDPETPQNPAEQKPVAEGSGFSGGPQPAGAEDVDVEAVALVSVPVPELPAPVSGDDASPRSPVLSAGDAALLTVVGRVVAGFVVVLGVGSAVLCVYAAYRIVLWLWFTP